MHRLLVFLAVLVIVDCHSFGGQLPEDQSNDNFGGPHDADETLENRSGENFSGPEHHHEHHFGGPGHHHGHHFGGPGPHHGHHFGGPGPHHSYGRHHGTDENPEDQNNEHFGGHNHDHHFGGPGHHHWHRHRPCGRHHDSDKSPENQSGENFSGPGHHHGNHFGGPGHHHWHHQHTENFPKNFPGSTFEEIGKNMNLIDKALKKFCDENNINITSELYGQDNYILKYQLSGFKQSDFEVKIKNRLIYTTANSKDDSNLKAFKDLRILPSTVDTSRASWVYEHKTLKVYITYKTKSSNEELLYCGDVEETEKNVPNMAWPGFQYRSGF